MSEPHDELRNHFHAREGRYPTQGEVEEIVDRETREYRVVWTLEGREQMTERVESPAAAAKLIALRERFEGRWLADEEYGLMAITRSEGIGKISPWSDENRATIHAYVMAERLTLW